MTLQYIEREGKTVEEAMELALTELGVDRDKVSIKVLNEGSKGILGFGARQSKIRVTLKEDPSQMPEGILSTLLEKMEIEALIHNEMVDGNTQLIIDAKDPSLLIGRHGQTLDAIQYLINCIFNKSALVKKKIIVNAEGYRERREEMLVELAYRLSSKVKQTGRDLVMNPLPPPERRIIHLTLQNDDKVRTYSRGEGPMRSIVITTKDRFEADRRFHDDDY